MKTVTLIFKQITRRTGDGREESLFFSPGLNLIAGRPNTGKTVWLNMIDFMMGDSGSPQDAFGVEIADKYDSISCVIQIGDSDYVIERNWKKRGAKSKIYVDNVALSAEQFSDFLLETLGIPNLHFPKGNPVRGAWPRLSWRALYRHIYRQQRFWSDFADKQPDAEQHACLLLFLGIAEYLYSDEYETLSEKRREQYRLEISITEFERILDRISRELLDEHELTMGVTPQSLDLASRRLQGAIAARQQAREAKLVALKTQMSSDSHNGMSPGLQSLGDRWARLQSDREEVVLTIAKMDGRVSELGQYESALRAELGRIDRAARAGQVLAPIKITHCPACDQPVLASDVEGTCFLCKQSLPSNSNNLEDGTRRIDSEKGHLAAELEEVARLLQDANGARSASLDRKRGIDDEIGKIEGQLSTVRSATASIISPDIAIDDMEIGGLQERVRQLSRVRNASEIGELLSGELEQIKKDIDELDMRVKHLMSMIDYSSANNAMNSGMAGYLTDLNANGRMLWNQPGRIRWKISPSNFSVTINDSNWATRLGGTLTLYFLIAYHYALMTLTNRTGCHYPGIVVLDLPATLDDGTAIADYENYSLLPLRQLMERQSELDLQVIVAGSSFEHLDSANLIELNHQWS